MLYSPNRIAYYRDRCRPPLTQKALSLALGRHVNTVVMWEKRGAPAPADLLQLVAFFVAHGAISDEATARQFWEVSGREPFAAPPELAQIFTPAALPGPEAMPTDAPPPPAAIPTPSLMPLHRNRLFVGRVGELLALAAALREPGATAAICGLGGLGKTQLACEFAHRYGRFFPGGVFWVGFGDPGAIPAALAACGRAGHLALHPNFVSLPLDQQVQLVLAAWRDPLPRLLIFDNCEDEDLLAEWRPPTGGCRVIVTSRRAHWSPALVALALPLACLPQAESVALLLAHAAARPAAALESIAAELDGLPLALQLAGAYLARQPADTGPARYLAELRAESAQGITHPSLQSGGFSPTGHEQHVGRAFALSYRQLRHDEPADRHARALLARAARFAPGKPIPRAILLATADPQMAEAGLARLSDDLSLLESGEDDTLRIHRLVAGFVRAADPDPAAQVDVERVVLAEAQQLNEGRLPTSMIIFQPHLRAVAKAAAPRADAMAAELCAELGWHLTLLGSYDEAHRYIERSLAMREAAFGPDHPETAKSLSLLGLAHQFQGALIPARPLYERALAIREQSLGSDHIETATDCNNLGYLLFHLDEYASARSYLWRALLIRRRSVGLKDAGTARTLSNLGYVLMHSGSRAAARRYLKLALAIREQVLPTNHPATAQTLNNLGEVLFAQGDYSGACRYHERALAMRDAVFGPNHFHAAESMRNLALVLHAQRDIATARAYLERAIAICEVSLGERHIETAWKLESMGMLLCDQADYAAGRAYLERALAVYRELLHEDHHTIARVQGLLEPPQ